MRAFEISGGNGTYLELEDGRFADTVSGDGDHLDNLRAEVTEYVTKPLCTQFTIAKLQEYVGV